MGIQRMENVAIVFADLSAAAQWFVDLGMTVVDRAPVQGEWVDRVVGLEGTHSEIVMLETPGGHTKLELTGYHSPAAVPGIEDVMPNTLGFHRVAFTVDDLDAAVSGLRERGTELVGEVVNYDDVYKLCYVRGPEGIVVMLAEELQRDAEANEG